MISFPYIYKKEGGKSSGIVFGDNGTPTLEETVIIPSNVQELPQNSVFSSSYAANTRNVTVEEGSAIVKIGTSAFSGISGYANYVSIDLSNATQLTELGANVFNSCTQLKYVKLPESITKIGSGLFINCTSLEELEMPSKITSDANGLCSGCTALKKLVLNSVITSARWKIENNSQNPLYRCRALETLVLPNGWTESMFISNGGSSYANELTVESIIGIFNSLYDYSGGSSHTLVLGSKNLARVTDEQKKIATDKNWTLS